jgi:hypothetical protein
MTNQKIFGVVFAPFSKDMTKFFGGTRDTPHQTPNDSKNGEFGEAKFVRAAKLRICLTCYGTARKT